MRQLWKHYLACARSYREETVANVLSWENDFIRGQLRLQSALSVLPESSDIYDR